MLARVLDLASAKPSIAQIGVSTLRYLPSSDNASVATTRHKRFLVDRARCIPASHSSPQTARATASAAVLPADVHTSPAASQSERCARRRFQKLNKHLPFLRRAKAARTVRYGAATSAYIRDKRCSAMPRRARKGTAQ